jgi:cyclopropane fatty-acyl-phospholipid synthase-like methyltransferase
MTNEDRSDSARYWDEHLLSWEASAYYRDTPRRAGWWDRLSTVFRGDAMYVRMRSALELVRPHAQGKSVLDVGCASGRFAFQLIEAGAARVHGVDISRAAVELARLAPASATYADRLDFRVEDLIRPAAPLPRVDIVTALGVIEYFDAATMDAFLGNLRTQYVLLDFPDLRRRREFPTWMLRQIYIRVHRLPGVFLYSLERFAEIAGRNGLHGLRVVERNRFYFVTNLPA